MTGIMRYEIKFKDEEEKAEMHTAINEWLKIFVIDTKTGLSSLLMAPDPGSSETKYMLFSLAAPFTVADPNELAAKITYCLMAKLAIDRNLVQLREETKESLLHLYELLPKSDEMLAGLGAQLDLIATALPPFLAMQTASQRASQFVIPRPEAE